MTHFLAKIYFFLIRILKRKKAESRIQQGIFLHVSPVRIIVP